MRLVVTGGGTGGHVYPALEVGRLAHQNGADLLYLGSLRGQESGICASRGIRFFGFGSAPLYSLRSARGWKSLAGLLRARAGAKRCLKIEKPDVVFSTGGYSAAPVMAAARSLGIPYVIHEANSVPGRSNRMFARRAKAFTYLFRGTERHIRGVSAYRVGNPIRRELRDAAKERLDGGPLVIVLGGSQGSAFLNDLLPFSIPAGVRVIHASGKDNVAAMKATQLPAGYQVVPYLETPELVQAYRSATVAVARSGSILAEFAMFGLPSVLVPLPTSADDHQLHNAEEFAKMGAATLLGQSEASPDAMKLAIDGWLSAPERRMAAACALAEWDVPDATERIVAILEKAAQE